jgi:hypothetical protein
MSPIQQTDLIKAEQWPRGAYMENMKRMTGAVSNRTVQERYEAPSGMMPLPAKFQLPVIGKGSTGIDMFKLLGLPV